MISHILEFFFNTQYLTPKFFFIYLARCVLLPVLLVSISSNAFSQIVEGVVRDKASYEPLVGATVFVEEIQDGTVTNSHGFFSFNGQNKV